MGEVGDAVVLSNARLNLFLMKQIGVMDLKNKKTCEPKGQ